MIPAPDPPPSPFLLRQRVRQGAVIASWACLDFPRSQEAPEFCQELVKMAREMGVVRNQNPKTLKA